MSDMDKSVHYMVSKKTILLYIGQVTGSYILIAVSLVFLYVENYSIIHKSKKQ